MYNKLKLKLILNKLRIYSNFNNFELSKGLNNDDSE